MYKLLLGLGALFIVSRLGAGTASGSSTERSTATNSNSKLLASPTRSGMRRNCDPKGCGHYGASRGSRKHWGVDYSAAPGESIYSPISGQVSRYPNPYGDGAYSGVEIVGTGHHDGLRVKMFYLSPSVAIGQLVARGQLVGRAQNITTRHGADMINHVHVELYKNGANTDISPLVIS